MSERKMSSREGYSRRERKISGREYGTPAVGKDNLGDVRTFEFEGCSSNFGIVLENRNLIGPSRTRSALGNIKVAEITPHSVAEQDGRLAVGDRVLEINNHDLTRASLERARWYLGSALRGGKLKIQVQRESSKSKTVPVTNGISSPAEMRPETMKEVQNSTVRKLHILKDSHGLGVQISIDMNHVTGEKGVFVSDINPGGAAARDGRLQEGDELLWINGHSLIGITQQEAVDLLRASPKLIQLVISRQGDKSSNSRKPRGRSESQENIHGSVIAENKFNVTNMKRRAGSVDNLFGDRNKKAAELANLKIEGKAATRNQLENGLHGSIHLSSEMNGKGKSVSEKTNLSMNVNTRNPANGARRQYSRSPSESSSDGSIIKADDLLISKEDESLESEPVTLEDKPLKKGSEKVKSPPKSSPSLMTKTATMQDPPSPSVNTAKRKVSDIKSSLEISQISPSLPKPQTPGGLGIAFPARYLGDSSPQVMTVGVPTPLKVVGNNERDSAQAKRKENSGVVHEQNGIKGIEEEVLTIVLVKGMSGKGLGFTIVGGKDSPLGDMAVYIQNILPGGAAEADGRMKRGDELLSVNGTSFESFSHQQALETFKSIRRGIVTLKVRRNGLGSPSLSTFTAAKSSPGSSQRNSKDITEDSASSSSSSSPTMFRKLRQKRNKKGKSVDIVLYKDPGGSLGIGLGKTDSYKLQGIFVQCIIQGSPAANDGRLRQGDQLLEINDQKIENLSVEEVYSILDKVPPGKVYLKVTQKPPLQLSGAVTKLQSDCHIHNRKAQGVQSASSLSGASESSDSADNLAMISSSCDPLIPLFNEPGTKPKDQAKQDTEVSINTTATDASDCIEDIYTIVRQPSGGLGMGVTIDKSRGKTIAEKVSIKSVIAGGSAALARSQRRVGLELGDEIIEVNGTHLKGMDQEDVIKIFRDLPGTTQMKIRRSKTHNNTDLTLRSESVKQPLEKAAEQEPVVLPKPPENKRRSSLRTKVQPEKQDLLNEKPVNVVKMNERSLTGHPSDKNSPLENIISKDTLQNGNEVFEEAEKAMGASEGVLNKSVFPSKKSISGNVNASESPSINKSVEIKDELGDNLIIPTGYRKVTISIKKSPNSTLGISLVPSYGKLKGFFQIRRLLSGMVCAQDGQLRIGDRLVSVNGVSLKGVTHSLALQLLKKPMEQVIFVILREGLETLRDKTSGVVGEIDPSIRLSAKTPGQGIERKLQNGPSSPDLALSDVGKASIDDSYLQSSLELQPSSISALRAQRSKLETTEESTIVLSPLAGLESQEVIVPGKSENTDEILPDNTNEEITPDEPPELPCSPPPPPLLDVEDFFDDDNVSVPSLPSLSLIPSPLPSEVTSTNEEDFTISSLPIVTPPPELSPRMRDIIEQDALKPGDSDGRSSCNSSDINDILPETSSINQAVFSDDTNFQTSSKSDDSMSSINDDQHSSEPPSVTESKSSFSLSHMKPSIAPLASQASIPLHLISPDNLPSESPSNKFLVGSDKSFGKKNSGGHMGSSDLPLHLENNNDHGAEIKAVEGRRVENMPFAITYQKKFRSLGMKVDASQDGNVFVSELSSFGMVAKDGNIRIGDVILSIGNTSLDGVALDIVQDMIKNCPKGNVRIVAKAGANPWKPLDHDDDTVIQNTMQPLCDETEVGQCNNVSFSTGKVEGNCWPKSGGSHKAQVDLPGRLIGNENSNEDCMSLLPSKEFQRSEKIVPTQRSCPEVLTTAEEYELVWGSNGLESAKTDDLPPPSPPPPVPSEDVQLENWEASDDELFGQDIVQDTSLNPPSIFGDHLEDTPSDVGSNSDRDDENEKPSLEEPCPALLGSTSEDYLPLNQTSVISEDASSNSYLVSLTPSDKRQQQLPIKPPSLFGDDTESLSPVSPEKRRLDSFDEDTASLDEVKTVPIKPPSLFGDDRESLPSVGRLPSPPKRNNHSANKKSFGANSSNSSSALQPPLYQRKSLDKTSEFHCSNTAADSFDDDGIDAPDDDSLPPAPPPPRSSMTTETGWSVRSSDMRLSHVHEHPNAPYISSPFQPTTQPERMNSKKRILPIRIRSKKGGKTSDRVHASLENDPSSNHAEFDDQPRQMADVEPPEDDMESLPPAPPPPKVSPFSLETLENIVDGYQPSIIKEVTQLDSGESGAMAASSGETSPPAHSPKKKRSFREIVMRREKEQVSQPPSQPVTDSLCPETKSGVDISTQEVTSLYEEIAVTDSFDAMSPPSHFPPEMELWSESESAKAELALLDQVLSLEDSSKSGNELSSEGGSTPRSKRVAFSKSAQNETATDIEILPSKPQKASDFSEHSDSVEDSVQKSPDAEAQSDLPSLDSHSLTDKTKPSEDSEMSPSEVVYCEVIPRKFRRQSSKQEGDGNDMGDAVQQRGPAPPIPVQLKVNNNSNNLSRKSRSAGLGIEVLPSKPDVKSKSSTLPVHRPQQKEQKKKLFSKSHKNKQDQSDSNYLEPPVTPLDANSHGRERSRSWTQKLFGFRSRSKSRDKTSKREEENRQTDRGRSVSPPRGLFARGRKSSPSPPPPYARKVSTRQGRKDIHETDLSKNKSEFYVAVEMDPNIPTLQATRASSIELNDNKETLSVEGMEIASHSQHEEVIGGFASEDDVINAEARFYGDISRDQSESDPELDEDYYTYLSEGPYDGGEGKGKGIDICPVEDHEKENEFLVSLETSITKRPLPEPPKRARGATPLNDKDDQVADEENVPKKLVSKPPVAIKSSSVPNRLQHQQTVEELKLKFNKASSLDGTHPVNTGNSFREELSSPGPPTFKPKPPPLASPASADIGKIEDDHGELTLPTSPGSPRFKPEPPPLEFGESEAQYGLDDDEPSDEEHSTGPPSFKPQPPPSWLLKNANDLDTEDQPSMRNPPHFSSVPTPPSAAKRMQKHNTEQEVSPREVKHLPPAPSDVYVHTSTERDTYATPDRVINQTHQRLPFSRQDAQDYTNHEDGLNTEIMDRQSELSEVEVDIDRADQLLLSSEAAQVKATDGYDDGEVSDQSSDWDETGILPRDDRQDNTFSQPGEKFTRSASFSGAGIETKQLSHAKEPKRLLPDVSLKRPPEPIRRSSSLPQLLPEKQRSDNGDHWHSGNLQELINSRNQEANADEGVFEVQLLKEQQSIGLMVVGGLDTHLGMLYIKDIQPDSPAANCKVLRTGDQLLQVNDNCLVGVTHGEALNILKNTPPLVKLTVARKKDDKANDLDVDGEQTPSGELEEPILCRARESSTISKTAEELCLSPQTERQPRPKSCIILSSFGTVAEDDPSSQFTSLHSSFDKGNLCVPAYLQPDSPTLNLQPDDVPVTIIDGIPEDDSDVTEEEEPRPRSKSVSWAVSDDTSRVFTVELLKNGRIGLGLSVTGGVDTSCDDIMVRQILSSSVTAQNGLIKRGDILLSVNGKSFKGLTNMQALNLLKNTPNRVTLVLSRPLRGNQSDKSDDRDVFSDSEAWPTRGEINRKKNLVGSRSSPPPTLERIPLDLVKQNNENSRYDRLKKKFFSNPGSKTLKERLQKVHQGPSVTEIALEKGASGLGFSLGGGQDSLYGDAPIHVRYVFKDSVAGRSGKLKPGDEILEVNGQRVAYMTSVDALELIRRLPYGPVVMKIRRQ